MGFNISDIYIGEFPTLQSFGEKPEVYNARFPIKAHNGIDFGCPSMTPVLSAADGFVSEMGFDPAGYGNYVKIVHDGFLTLYAHLNDVMVKKDDKVFAGNLIGHSNNTGFSDTPHLHFGVAPCDQGGNKSEKDNGYGGYIDPLGTLCVWNVKGLKAPIVADILDTAPPLSIAPEQMSLISTQSNNFLTIMNYLSNHFPTQISAIESSDPNAGKQINDILAQVLLQLSTQNAKDTSDISRVEQAIEPLLTPTNISTFKKLYNVCKGFIFTQS